MKSTCRLSGVLCSALCLSLLIIPVKLAIADTQSKRIAIEYEPPKNPAHQPLYEMLKERRVLEKLQEIFSPFQLPIELTFKTVGCDGVSNAWYSRPTVSICYEYLAEIQRDMPKETTPAGVTPADSVLGQFFYAVAHETGHAMFDLLNVPVFGHQEDAADQFAGYIILQFGKADARRLILGAAHSYKKYVQNPTVTAPLTAFSDEHGPPAQRFYNLLCLAYGADPVLFADVVDKAYLPKERARLCSGQFGELTYAFHQLIAPHLDRQLAKQVMDKSWLPPDDMPRGTAKSN
jgi:Putative metallopeptidase